MRSRAKLVYVEHAKHITSIGAGFKLSKARDKLGISVLTEASFRIWHTLARWHFFLYYLGVISKADIKNLATLARLEVSDEELSKLEREIPDILKFVETIQAVSGKAKESALTLINVMRADENPHEGGTYTEALIKAAPARVGNRIAVKQVIKRSK